MALFRESTVRDYAQRALSADRIRRNAYSLRKSEALILESITAAVYADHFDMFLSHTIRDAEIILGMKELFAEMGYKVYIDWIDDPQLDRRSVNRNTADKIRSRMQQCNSLFFVTTQSSLDSKWMPWECGYFDGIKSKVAIVPVVQYSSDEKYRGQEYLGLYPYCEKSPSKGGKELLYVFEDAKKYLPYDEWVKQSEPIKWYEI
ncbi:hypothetical protein Geob_2713 [Geotalea daltonii FRC-32]|uniref:TIR domain-containing protein n=1 Tax=Geotalea daltonii (strain DSM 22248 / JCM 15807 / FRC-32) TaxID=316067 RepID=B9M1I1_GEODF|nr:TIR domain-containing protein [Geotalea daltonii]ACM21063.1 hypothetical protein Geob_2713 [Geotalea daltonii FRC-32]